MQFQVAPVRMHQPHGDAQVSKPVPRHVMSDVALLSSRARNNNSLLYRQAFSTLRSLAAATECIFCASSPTRPPIHYPHPSPLTPGQMAHWISVRADRIVVGNWRDAVRSLPPEVCERGKRHVVYAAQPHIVYAALPASNLCFFIQKKLSSHIRVLTSTSHARPPCASLAHSQQTD